MSWSGSRLFCCPFRGDELVEPFDFALAGLESELMQLAGVAIERAARPRHRLAQAFAALLDLTPAAFQDAHPCFRRRAVEEGQVHSEAVVGVVVRTGVGHQLAETLTARVGKLVDPPGTPDRSS